MRKSLTLVELVLSIMLMSVLVGWFGTIMIQVTENLRIIESRQDVTMQAKIALDWMVNDIREVEVAGADLSIDSATATQISFTSITGEAIVYELSGTQLLRNNNILCENVTELSFEYRDQDHVEMDSFPLIESDRQRIHHILITLALTRRDLVYELNSWATIRNVVM